MWVCALSTRENAPQLIEAVRDDGVPHPRAPLVCFDEPRFAQDFEVMAHRGLTLADWFNEVAGTNLPRSGCGDEVQELEPDRVSEGPEGLRQHPGIRGVQRFSTNGRATGGKVEHVKNVPTRSGGHRGGL